MGKSPAARRSPFAAGFSLVELLVAILILGAMMVAVYGFVTSTVRVKRRMEQQIEGLVSGPAILAQIATDVRGAYLYDIKGGLSFHGEDKSIGMSQDADSLHLFTTRNSRSPDDMQVSTSSDLSEVSYVLRQNPSEPAFLELFRREQFFIDGVVERGGRYRKVHDRVIRFNVEYYGGGTDMEEDVEGESSWSAGSEGRLPKALRLQLELATSDDPEGEYRLFEQIINLPLGSNMKTTELSPLLASMRQSLSEEGDQAGGDAAGGGAGRRQRGRGGRNNRNNRGQGGDAAEELFGPRRGGGGRDGGRDR